MQEYLNLAEKSLMVEYLTFNGDVLEVLSINMDKISSKIISFSKDNFSQASFQIARKIMESCFLFQFSIDDILESDIIPDSLVLQYYTKIKSITNIVSKMDRQQTSYDENQADSRQIISYSRLADQIDRQDEDNKNNKIQEERKQDKWLGVSEPLNYHRKNAMLDEFQREETQFILDGPQIKINYCSKEQQKSLERETKSLKIAQITSPHKGMSASGPIKPLDMKPMISSKLRPITENQSQNKRSDEQALEQKNLQQSEIQNKFQTSSMAALQHTKNIFPSNKLTSTVNKVCNIRAIDDSVQVVDNDQKDFEGAVKEQNLIKNKIQKVNHDLDNRIFSSSTTASKFAAKNVVQFTEYQANKGQEQIKKLTQKISKMESTILTLIGGEKNKPQTNCVQTDIRKNVKSINSQKVIKSQGMRVMSVSKPSDVFRIGELDREYLKFQKQQNFSFKQLKELIKSQLWKQILQVDAQRAEQIKRILEKIALLLGFSLNFSVCLKEPFTVEFQNNQILIISYSKKIYIGQHRNDKGYYIKHGIGLQIDPQKSIYQGSFIEGVKEGKGKILLCQRYTYNGSWKAGTFQGEGVLRRDNKSVYVGSFQNGKKHGEGIQYFQTGDRFEGSFQNNAFHGQGKYFWRNGSRYQGNFRNDEMHGVGKWVSAKGDQYQGNYANSKKEGHGVYLWKSGKKYEGEFKNGLPRMNSESKNCDISFFEQSTSPKKFKIYFNH